jgi:hypothetical protein
MAITALIAAFLVFGIGAGIYSFQKCGFTQTMMSGKNAFWAAVGGYCDD